MFRKLSRHLSQRKEQRRAEREVSPELICAQARRIEGTPPGPRPRRSWENGDEADFYTNSRLEALSLENIIAPTLTRMAPTMATREALAPPPPRGMEFKPPVRPPLAHLAPPRETDVLILSRPLPGITATPDADIPDPFEQLSSINELQITNFPPRPVLRRKAVSYRTQRDLPLRVQAVRRAHQEEFSRRLAERPVFEPLARRGSAPGHSRLIPQAPPPVPSTWQDSAKLKPPRPMTPQAALRRTRSEAQLHQVPQRQHSQHRVHTPMPDAAGSYFDPHPGDDVTDHYIQSAEYLWTFPRGPAKPG